MSQQINDNVSMTVSAARLGTVSYTSNLYGNWHYENIAAVRVPLVQGGYFVGGPGVGYGQIFPVMQDR